MKHCRHCNRDLPTTAFSKATRYKDGLNTRCRECAAAYYQANRERLRAQQATYRPRNPEKTFAAGLRWRYNMTVEQYQQMERDQHGVCCVCEQPQKDGKRLVVDHDHSCCPGIRSCGMCVRGLLCNDCNHAAGYLRDNPERAFQMAAYLLATRCRMDMLTDPDAVVLSDVPRPRQR